MPSCARKLKTSQRSRPNTRTDGAPFALANGYSCRVSSFINVDFPAPFGPRMAVCSPTRIVSVRPSRMRVPPSTTDASQISSSGGCRSEVIFARVSHSGNTGIQFAHRKERRRFEMNDWKERLYQKQEGAMGYILLWLMGVPATLLFGIFLLRGCN